MTFKQPIFLLGILPIIALCIYFYRRQINPRQKFTLCLRALVFLLIFIALAQPILAFNANETGTVFLVDRSKSSATYVGDFADFIKDALPQKNGDDSVGLASFGLDSVVEHSVDNNFSGADFRAQINDNFTNLENALTSANFMFSPQTNKRIVLMTDGKANVGDYKSAVNELVDGGVTVDVYIPDAANTKEVELTAVNTIQDATIGQTVGISADVTSNFDTAGKLYIYAGGSLVNQQEIDIKKGNNTFNTNYTITQNGTTTIRAEIVPDGDTIKENNVLSNFVTVNDMPRILVVEHQGSGQNYQRLLSNYQVDVVQESAVYTSYEKLLGYDGFILANVSLENVNPEFIDALDILVKEQGKGLMVSGGDRSFALGGYFQTKLEDMLPVTMDVKDKEKEENLAMVLVIDKSGSMNAVEYGITNIELAKEAAVRTLDILNDKDRLGVIAFDSAVKWVVKLVDVTDKSSIENNIGTIVPGGGTSILPPLSDAVDALAEDDAALKHIILLTDGAAEQSGYLPVIEKARDNGITISTVAVGAGADANLLRSIAENGNGRFYQADVFSNIPTIFSKEATLAGKKYLNHINFFPKLQQNSPVMNGIVELPALDGYVSATEKPRADIVLSGPDDAPILTTYQYGLGRTLAFTSDMDGLWSNNWLSWEGNQTLWQNVMSYLTQKDYSLGYDFDTQYTEGKAQTTLTFDNINEISEDTIDATVTSPSGESFDVALNIDKPGAYTGDFKASTDGIYLVNAKLPNDKGVIASAIAVPYPDDYKYFGEKSITATEIVNLSGGTVLSSPKDVFNTPLVIESTEYDLFKWLIVLALLVFILELVYRMTRLPMPKLPQMPKINLAQRQQKTNVEPTLDVKKDKPKPKEDSKKLEKRSHLDDLLDD